jgi:hypothetical protein
MKVRLSGTALEAIRSGGFGLHQSEPEADKLIRQKLEAAPGKKVGYGYRYEVELDREQVRRLAESVEIQGEALLLGARDNPEDDSAYREARALVQLGAYLREVATS